MYRTAIQFARRMSIRSQSFSDAEYVRLADFRHALRHYLEFSSQAARSEGLTLVSNNVREFERVEALQLTNWVV